jgi:nickel/cobalt transporter (NicO) family protein
MNYIVATIVSISILHALIPSHWLPLLAISKNNKWSQRQTMLTAFYMSLAHVASTAIIGIALGYFGRTAFHHYAEQFEIVAPILLLILGLVFIYRHYRHHHFHISKELHNNSTSNTKIIISLASIMFLSPCLEVEGVFLSAGKFGMVNVLILIGIYAVVSIAGIVLWVWVALHGLKKLNWHRIEHSSGLITGIVLIICGIFTYYYH